MITGTAPARWIASGYVRPSASSRDCTGSEWGSCTTRSGVRISDVLTPMIAWVMQDARRAVVVGGVRVSIAAARLYPQYYGAALSCGPKRAWRIWPACPVALARRIAPVRFVTTILGY